MSEPIAWTWTGRDGHPQVVARVGVATSLEHPDKRPVEAVPLVPADPDGRHDMPASEDDLSADLMLVADRIEALGVQGWIFESYAMQIRAFARKVAEAQEAIVRREDERKARVEELAERMYIQHELRVRGDGKWQPWSDVGQYTHDTYRADATALDAQGYRKSEVSS